MKTTIEITGFPELILEKAVESGLARSKTDAIRIGILALNDKFKLAKPSEIAKKDGKPSEKPKKDGPLKEVMEKYLK